MANIDALRTRRSNRRRNPPVRFRESLATDVCSDTIPPRSKRAKRNQQEEARDDTDSQDEFVDVPVQSRCVNDEPNPSPPKEVEPRGYNDQQSQPEFKGGHRHEQDHERVIGDVEAFMNSGENGGVLTPSSDDIMENQVEGIEEERNDPRLPINGTERPVAVRGSDGKFPGEDYEGPEKLLLRRGRVTRSNECCSQVVIRYHVTAAVICPCDDADCRKLVNVGTWGRMGCGSTVCVHCGHKREGKWDGVGYGFMGKEDLVRHLNSAQCRRSRGLPIQKRNHKDLIGSRILYKINNPDLIVTTRNKQGVEQSSYKCYVCQKVVVYRSRYSHHLKAKHEIEVTGSA